jgi:hypothetical protein
VAVYFAMLDVQRLAAGTRLERPVDDTLGAMEGIITGSVDAAQALAAGEALADECR